MRRIIQVTPNYPPRLGGLERVVEILATELARTHPVGVITTDVGASGAPRRAVEAGVRVARHRAVSVAHTALSPGMFADLLSMPRDAVVHLHCAQAVTPELVWLSTRIRRMRYIVHFHMDVDASGALGRLLPVYKKQFFGRVLRGAAGVIVLTASQAGFLNEYYGVAADRIHVVPNGVADEYFLDRSGPARSSVPTDTDPLRLLYVGRLGSQKNVARLLDAMARITTPVRLRIVGDGELRPDLEAQTARLGLAAKVEFAGRLHGPALVQAYSDAEAFILPSDREGMPLVVMEAMAAGLPVIATAVPGNIELVEGAGLLATPDPTALAAAIDRIATEATLRADLAAAGTARAKGYSWAAVVAAIEDVYTRSGV